jgi:BTB/POZ domain
MPPAGPPFDDPSADLILRSNDGVDFHVFKIILSLASKPLAEKFIKSEDADGVRVVEFTQDSKFLDLVLRHLYPVPLPGVTWREVRPLAEFAEYFDVKALKPMIERYLEDDYLKGDPVLVYSIAVTYGYPYVAAKAARLSLQLHISDLKMRLMKNSTAGPPYWELVKYHTACGVAASAVASDRKWFPPWEKWGRLIWTSNFDGSSNIRCETCATPDFIYEPPIQIFWPQTYDRDTERSDDPQKRTRFAPGRLWTYLERSSSVLAHHPTSKEVTEEEFVMASRFHCSWCIPGTREDILEFSRIFAMEVEKAIEQVSVSIRFVFPAP